MSEIALKLEGIGKKYQLGHKKNQSLAELLKNFSFFNGSDKKLIEEFWALKDVSFEIKQGEAVGIIGKNGAGKSTLLKILSRITDPTKGRIEINGRISSLLEVGTGFHPELSGRENIFLNGTILGMKRAEIKQKFDEIVEFSGVEKFLDTPVKHYSSGMYVRLAFAVAAHLEPEILIIDEVLAVGDAEFQNKCLGKMKEVTGQGRTVLFVSHNMAAIKQFCTSGIFLKNGSIQIHGEINKAIDSYLNNNKTTTDSGAIFWPDSKTAPGGKEIRLISVRSLDEQNNVSDTFDTSKQVKIEIRYKVLEHLMGLRINLIVLDKNGIIAFASSNHDSESSEKTGNTPGEYSAICSIPSNLLNGGEYGIKINAGCPGIKLLIEGDTYLVIKTTLMGNNNSIYLEKWPGIVAPKLKWDNYKF